MRSRRLRVAVTAALAAGSFACVDRAATAPDAQPTPVRDVVAALPAVHVSEIHYDNVGTDANERIEITAPAGTNLSGWSLILYNGANGQTYSTTNLTGIVPDQCSGRGTVVISYPVNGIQNGDPDGWALVNAGAVVEFLSYEGTFAATNGPAIGMTSADIGVAESNSTTLDSESLQRTSAGWSGPKANSFGACNAEVAVPVATVTVTPTTATVTAGGTTAYSASAQAANGDPAPATFTWSSGDVAVATIDPVTGVATGVAAGTTTVRATAQNGVFGEATIVVQAAPPPSPAGAVVISEVMANPAGLDSDREWFELYNPGASSVNVEGWTLSSNAGSVVIASPTVIPAGGYALLARNGNAATNGGLPTIAYVYNGAVINLNNSNGWLRIRTPAGTTADSVAWATVPDGSSRALADLAADNVDLGSAVWYTSTTAYGAGGNGSPGAANPPPGSSSGAITFTGRDLSDPPLPVGFEDQLFATQRSGGVTVPTTFTWASETPTIASVDANGVVRALAAGTAVIRATAADGTTGTYSLPTRVATAGSATYGANTEFGIPTDGDPSDDYVLVRDEFTSSYNRLRNIPNWVSYNLDGDDLGAEDRCDCFTFDPLLPAAFTRYTTADYTGAGAAAGFGIDRGHLAPSADRTTGSLDNARTFLFSNIIPQAADNNQGPWAQFESYLRDLVRNENREVYVITGAYGSQGTVKNEGVITIPTRTWKVVLVLPAGRGLADVDDPSDVLDVIAIDLPNSAGIRNDPWQTFRTTVDAVEAASGYDLLARLPDDVERVLEAQRNVRNYEIDIRPNPLSLANTAIVNVVLLSRADFDAVAVDAGNLRLVVAGGTAVEPNRRGSVVNTSVADFNGDGRPDRLIAFRMSDLRAAGFSAAASELVLRPAGATPAWEARDFTPPTIIP